jgi:methyltransferase (TIGR00027 family)
MISADEQWDVVSGVGLTALGVAAARALETHRTDALVQDRLAEQFVKNAQPSVAMPTSPDDTASSDAWRSMADCVGVRSRFFDEYVITATESGVDQIVVLAAGLDARAYRLNWPRVCHLYEVDQPKVLEFKDAVLGKVAATTTCTRHVVGTDLREDWAAALLAAGFDPARPTAWLAEGLLPYLPAAAEDQLFDQIDRLSSPGSRIAVEHVSDVTAVVDHPMINRSVQQLGVDIRELWNREPRRPVDERLRSQGWVLTSESIAETARCFGRELDTDSDAGIGEYIVLCAGSRG